MKLYAVIPTVGERNDILIPMVRQLSSDDVTVILVHNRRDHQSFPECGLYGVGGAAPYIYDHVWEDDEPVNLSLIWNLGLDWARELAEGEDYVVAVFNDDLTIPAGVVQRFADRIEDTGAAVAHASPRGQDIFYSHPGDWFLGNRMVGYAFALRGSAGLRADEDFLWWWGDSDLDLRARQSGGVVEVAVPGLTHHDPNGYTNRNPALYEQAGRDRETFVRKHGFLPW